MAAPIRGTQSFVAIMGQVWRRPSLTALEMAWRWLPAFAALLLSGILLAIERTLGIGIFIPPQTSRDVEALQALQSLSVFQPVVAVDTVHSAVTALLSLVQLTVRQWMVVLVGWSLIAALGRTIVLRRLNPTLHARRVSIFVVGALRALLLAGAWALWFWGLSFAAHTAITAPAARGEEPSLVLFAAMLICGTLTLYVLWAVFSWFLQLAPLLAMRDKLGAIAAVRAALTSPRALRGKLIEINLVMNIVRIALIVLAMVFSASPLPFSSVETQAFLTCWWCGVGVFYLAVSDYFHVVRAAAYLSLYRAYAHDES